MSKLNEAFTRVSCVRNNRKQLELIKLMKRESYNHKTMFTEAMKKLGQRRKVESAGGARDSAIVFNSIDRSTQSQAENEDRRPHAIKWGNMRPHDISETHQPARVPNRNLSNE